MGNCHQKRRCEVEVDSSTITNKDFEQMIIEKYTDGIPRDIMFTMDIYHMGEHVHLSNFSSLEINFKDRIQTEDFVEKPSEYYKDKECSICLDSENMADATLKCGHSFHMTCINKYVKSKPLVVEKYERDVSSIDSYGNENNYTNICERVYRNNKECPLCRHHYQ